VSILFTFLVTTIFVTQF